MPRLTLDQRVWICIEFSKCNNAHEVIRRWPNRWQNVRPPTDKTVKQTFRKFEAEATCHNLNKGRSGRPRTVRTAGNINHVRTSLQQDGIRTSRRNGLNLSPSSFLRITKELKLHPYVLVKKQKLKDGDPARRLAFCNWFQNMNNANFLQNLIISDEAIFSLNSDVNSKNVIYYSRYGQGHPPEHYIEFEQGADQIMVWMGLTGTGQVLGPHFVRNRLDTREYLRIVRYNAAKIRPLKKLKVN